MTRTFLRTLILAVVVILFAGEPAWAWGPVTHIDVAQTVLRQVSLLPGVIAALLLRHPVAYLYGNIAADIVFAKRWSKVKQFCHHWSTGFRVLESARSTHARAFAYGYLSHLAADTVAHGKFVPMQIAKTRSPINLGHLYWELRADGTIGETGWQSLRGVLGGKHGDYHAVLRRQLTDTFLTYGMNRALFDGINTLWYQPTMRRTVSFWGRHARSDLSELALTRHRADSVDRIISVLSEGTDSAVLRDDPNGTSAFMRLAAERANSRRHRRLGLPPDGEHGDHPSADPAIPAVDQTGTEPRSPIQLAHASSSIS
jgi:hypothetical protein